MLLPSFSSLTTTYMLLFTGYQVVVICWMLLSQVGQANYHISSNKCSWCSFIFWSLKCGAYWRVVLRRRWSLFQSKTNYSHETSRLCNFCMSKMWKVKNWCKINTLWSILNFCGSREGADDTLDEAITYHSSTQATMCVHYIIIIL